MKTFTDFIISYWQNTRQLFDGLLLLVGLLALFEGRNVRLIGWAGIAIFAGVLFFAAMRTWQHEHEQVELLEAEIRSSKDDKLTFNKLSDIQKDILHTIDSSNEKSIVYFPPRAGTTETIFYGLQSISDKYEYNEFRAEIDDLVNLGVFSISDYAGIRKDPVYKPTKLFFKLLKEEKRVK